MQERLTKFEKTPNSMFPYKLKDDSLCTELDGIHKLGLIEDLLDQYNVKDSEELDKLLTMATSYEELSKQIGCPLDVRCKVVCGSTIYGIDGREYNVNYIEKDGFYCTRYFKWKDYGTKWFLENPRKDKSE